MAGKLYGVGVGPGDPELMTLKAKRVLESAGCIAIPKTAAEKGSTALSIAEGVIGTGKPVLELHFPMSYDKKVLEEGWAKAVEQIKQKLNEGLDVAFITLGDPTVYSTYIYAHKALKNEGYATEIIPGITSFCASAAKAGVSLGENRETIAVVPSSYEVPELESILDSFDNIVLMKVSKNLPRLKEILKSRGLENKAVLVSKCGMEDERVEFDLDSVDAGELSYFTTMIIKKSGVE